MKKLLTILVSVAALSASGQNASDFTIDDVDGNSRNLYTELNAGNVVVLKFFTNWCGICNNTADDVVAIYNNYQTAGDPVVFWALDRDPNETNADAIAYRNNNSIPFPVIGEASSVAQQFGVQYQPEYYIINPDRSYVQRTNFGSMQTAVDQSLLTLSDGIESATENPRVIVAQNQIRWTASAQNEADLVVFDASGRQVVDERITGEQQVRLDLPIGVYVYQLNPINGKSVVGKIGIAN